MAEKRSRFFACIGHSICVHWWLHQILTELVLSFCVCLPGHLVTVTLARSLVAPGLSFPPHWCFLYCSCLFPSPFLWPSPVLEMSPCFLQLPSLPAPPNGFTDAGLTAAGGVGDGEVILCHLEADFLLASDWTSWVGMCFSHKNAASALRPSSS